MNECIAGRSPVALWVTDAVVRLSPIVPRTRLWQTLAPFTPNLGSSSRACQ